mmetsp:Transcript_14347/g.33399  ORF Transcript_14347/g.33399 Transcript_14347/m.33399 type:complete len:237 (+) Transcript_14347:210-920(+)
MEPRKKNASKLQELPGKAKSDTQAEENEYGNNIGKHRNSTVAWRLLDWIEAQKVPACIAMRRRSSLEDDPYIISGLKKVFSGSQPAAEVVRIAGVRPPRYLCYMVSGSGCDVIQFLMYVLLYEQIRDASLCWALSFGGSIVFRHTTHRYLVFGDYVGGYWQSLGRMYAGYSIIIVLSTIFNYAVQKYVDMSHKIAWILTLLWTGIVNYMILKKLWSFGGSKKEDERKPDVLPRATA